MRTCHPCRAYIVLRVLDPSLDSIRFNTRFQGALTVNQGSDGLRMNFPALIPKPLGNLPETLHRALGQDVNVLEVAEVNEIYIARLGDEGAVRSLHPDFARLEQLHPFVAVVTAPGENADFVSHHAGDRIGRRKVIRRVCWPSRTRAQLPAHRDAGHPRHSSAAAFRRWRSCRPGYRWRS